MGISYCTQGPKGKIWQEWNADFRKEGRLSIKDGDTEYCLGATVDRGDGTRPRLVECEQDDGEARDKGQILIPDQMGYRLRMPPTKPKGER